MIGLVGATQPGFVCELMITRSVRGALQQFIDEDQISSSDRLSKRLHGKARPHHVAVFKREDRRKPTCSFVLHSTGYVMLSGLETTSEGFPTFDFR